MPGPYIEEYTPAIKQARGINTLLATTLGSTLSVTGVTTLTGAVTPTGGVAAAGGFSQSPRLISTGNRGAMALTDGTDTAFVTTDTYIAEVFVEGNVTITGVSVLQGTTAGNGHISVALANSSGVVVASSATTTTTGTATTYTKVAFSSTYAAVGPATYYVLVQGDATTDHIRMHAAGNFGAALKTSETYGTFTTITPPTTFTAAQGPIADLY
ncbi:MAG TPA: hypothetical protein VF941_11735 [Clostridia bacterium]